MENIYVITSENNTVVNSWKSVGKNVQFIFMSNLTASYLANTVSNILLNKNGSIIFAPSENYLTNRYLNAFSMLSEIKQEAVSKYKVDSTTFNNKVIISSGDENSILVAIGNINYASLPDSHSGTTTTADDITHSKTPDLVITAKTNPIPPSFDEIKPTANDSNIVQKNKYTYYFGFDKIQICKRDIKTDCSFVSDYINIDNGLDYIMLSCDYSLSEYSSIEFFIIDGSETIPILEENQKLIQKERLFQGILPIFPVDTAEPVEVFKDNALTSIKITDAISKTDGLYTVTYTPTEGWKYRPKSDKIKVKIIMRLYDKYSEAPTVSKVNIKQFGGDNLWQDSI